MKIFTVINQIGLAIKELFNKKSYFLVMYKGPTNMGHSFYVAEKDRTLNQFLREIEDRYKMEEDIVCTGLVKLSKKDFYMLTKRK